MLANIFLTEIFIPEAGMLTITSVKITDDLKIAKVYISFLEPKLPIVDIISILKSKNKIIRHHLGLSLSLKYTPILRFYHDNTLEHVQRIDNLINKINNAD
tara:strand:- start:56 stop:358 length:303 start_codon:yes stop_codon:yes gene_type:complete